MIVGLGHQARVGKDTAGNILVEHYGFQRFAFADTLKRVAFEANPRIGSGAAYLRDYVYSVGWEEAKAHPDVRGFLQRLGVAARDHIDPDVWVKPVLTEAWKVSMNHGDAVVTDVRFLNEFASLSNAGAKLIKLTRKEADGVGGSHISETALADAEWDAVIRNDGTLADLESQLVRVLKL